MGPLRLLLSVFAALIIAAEMRASDPLPSRSVAPDGRGYTSAVPINSTFPESSYGLTHNGSSFSITPATSEFGYPNHSIGSFSYQVNPFYPRSSEGVYEMEVWLEQQAGDGSWNAPDTNPKYWRIDTPNPGPSGSHTFDLGTFSLSPNVNYRVFGYVYMYNQGGSNQGAFPLYSTIGTINTGSANDAPRVFFTPPTGATNPSQITVGQTYKISADAEDDNRNLSVVRIWKNGVPFAFNPVSDATGNSQNNTSDSTPGTVTFTAQAEDLSGATSSTETWTVTILDRSDQPGISSANAGITLGQSFTPVYNGGAGSGGWQFVIAGQTNWDGSASTNTGTQLGNGSWSPSWTPTSAGTYTFYVTRNGDSYFKPSGVAGPYTLTVYGTPTVSWISTPPSQVTPGTALQWAAQASSPNVATSSIELHFDLSTDGGNSWVGNAYQFANNTTSNFVTAGAPGTTYLMRATVNDGTIGSNGFVSPIYNAVTVAANVQNVSISPTNPTVTAGSPITLTASGGQNGYVWGGSASGSGSSQTLIFNSPGSYTVTVYSPAGGAYSQSNTAATTVNVVAASQNVSVTPINPSIVAGQSVTFTASGGNNGYVWGGTPGANGTSQTVTFGSPGTYVISVYSPAGGIYDQSNTATTTVSVAAQSQTVAISPSSTTITAGQTVTFTASGGQNGYLWGGSGSGSGASNTVNFPNPGSYTVTVYSPAGGNYAQSNTAAATVTVNYLPPTASISAAPTSGIAPLTTLITWSTTSASSATVTGSGLNSNATSGSQNVTLAAGTYTYSINAVGPAGNATNSVTVNVAPNTANLATTSSSVNFGSVYRDTTAGTPTTSVRTLTFNNPGNASLIITAVSISGSGPFAVTSGLTLPYTLASGASANMTLTFGAGAAIGANSATLSVTASTNTAVVSLSGTGLAPKIGVTWK
jgi:plastocyanin